jgi:hypothetical protein
MEDSDERQKDSLDKSFVSTVPVVTARTRLAIHALDYESAIALSTFQDERHLVGQKRNRTCLLYCIRPEHLSLFLSLPESHCGL